MNEASRLRALRRAMSHDKIEAVLITHLPDVRYLCGFTGSNAALAVTAGKALGVHAHLFAFKQVDETALDTGELKRELQQRVKDVRDGPAGVELACGVQQKAELFKFPRRLRDVPVSWREHREGGK